MAAAIVGGDVTLDEPHDQSLHRSNKRRFFQYAVRRSVLFSSFFLMMRLYRALRGCSCGSAGGAAKVGECPHSDGRQFGHHRHRHETTCSLAFCGALTSDSAKTPLSLQRGFTKTHAILMLINMGGRTGSLSCDRPPSGGLTDGRERRPFTYYGWRKSGRYKPRGEDVEHLLILRSADLKM